MSGMIKIRRKNYIKEKAKEKYESNINYQIRVAGGISNDRYENKWRGKPNKINYLSLTEKNYQLNEIVKQFKSSKDELQGFSSKYLRQLSDLLGQKDKYVFKKRLELYEKRILNDKQININNKNEEKKNAQSYKNLSNINSKLGKIFNSNKPYSVTMYSTSRSKKNKNFIKRKVDKNNKTKNNLTVLAKSKSYGSKYFINKNKIAQNILLTEINSNEKNDNYEEDSIKGKEEFLLYGDKEKYQDYLKKEYNFFNDYNNTNQIIFLNDKNKRIKLFKDIPNYKFLEAKKIDQYKNHFFNKINKEENDICLNLHNLRNISLKNNKMNKTNKTKSVNNKIKHFKDCKKIFIEVKNCLL